MSASVRESVAAGPIMFGHFSKSNEWTEIDSVREGPRFMERFAPGAFTQTLAELTPKVLFQHGNDQVGKQPLGLPREIREDDQGARFEVDLFDGVPELILGGLRAGAYGASFQFSVRREDWVRSPSASPSNPDGIPERTVREARVMEFGPVTFPAYAGATAGVRAEELGEDGELRGAAFRVDDAMRRIADGYRMVTPIRPYHLNVNGKRETLLPGVARLAVDLELVRAHAHLFEPAAQIGRAHV